MNWTYCTSCRSCATTIPRTKKRAELPRKDRGKSSSALTANRRMLRRVRVLRDHISPGQRSQEQEQRNRWCRRQLLTRQDGLKGYVRGASAGRLLNFRNPSCEKQKKYGMCQTEKDCLFPKPCSQLEADHTEYIDVLKAVQRTQTATRGHHTSDQVLRYRAICSRTERQEPHEGEACTASCQRSAQGGAGAHLRREC